MERFIEKRPLIKEDFLPQVGGLAIHVEPIAHGIQIFPFKTLKKFLPEMPSNDPFDIERSVINDKTYKAVQELRKHFETFPLGDYQKSTWNNLELGTLEIFKAEDSLCQRVRRSASADHSEDQITLVEATIIVLKTASNLLLAKTLNNIVGFAEKYNFADKYLLIQQFTRFCHCEDVLTKIEGISIADLIAKDDIRMPDYYKSVTEASLAIDDSDYQKLLEKADNPLMKEYPQTAKRVLNDCCAKFAILSTVTPEIFDFVHVPTVSKKEKEIFDFAKGILKKTSKMKEATRALVFSPQSEDFSDLQSILTAYLDNKNGKDKILVIGKAGIDVPAEMITAHRMADRILNTSDGQRNIELYAKLMQTIEEAFEKRTESFALTINHAILFLKENAGQENLASFTFEDIKDLTKQILLKSVKKEYEVDPINVALGSLKIPKKIRVSFFNNKEQGKFAVSLIYDDKQGKTSKLFITFDTKNDEKKALEWIFLEDPNDPKMGRVKNSIMSSIYSCLQNIHKQVDTEYREIQKKKSTNNNHIIASTKIKNGDYVPREKPEDEEKTIFPKPLTPVEEEKQKEILPAAEGEIGIDIELPPKDTKEFRALMKDIAQFEDRKRIFDKIEWLKTHNSNQFKPINATHEKRPVFEFRIGRFRVLVTPKNSKNANGQSNGKAKYEPFKIDRRGEVFGNTTKVVY